MTDTQRRLPFKLGRYSFRRALGKGTQGAVYLAEMEAELGFRRKVAVKIVGEGTGGPERAIKSLANEARALAAAHHPNVVQVYDLARIDTEYLLVMEFVEGPTLAAALYHAVDHGRTVGVADALLLGEQIAEGLSCVHGLKDHAGRPAPMVHRDLKPGNVILSRHGQTKLVDFGLAKGRLVAFHTVVPNITRGTPAYMSPEQVRGEELSPASDQFSFGTMLFEVFTGHPLFRDANELAVMHRVMEGRPSADPELLRRTCPEAFPLIARCLSVDPAGRHGSMAELAESLRGLRRQLGLVADLRALAAIVEEETGELPNVPPEVPPGAQPGAQPQAQPPAPDLGGEFIEPSFPDLEIGDSFGEVVVPTAFEDVPTIRAATPPTPRPVDQLVDLPSTTDQCFVVDEDAEPRFTPDGDTPGPADVDELMAELPDLDIPASDDGGISGMGKGTEQFFFGDEKPAPSLAADPSTVERPFVPADGQSSDQTSPFAYKDLRPSEVIRDALRDPEPIPPMEPLTPDPLPSDPLISEPAAPFDPRGPDRPTPAPDAKPSFKDLMSRDVSFHGIKKDTKRMSFTGPRPAVDPSFDRESLPEDEDSDDGLDSGGDIPPWEVD